MNKRYVVSSVLGLIFFLGTSFEALAQHKGISFQAVMKKSDGSYPTASGITVLAQILDPINHCVLREEEHTGKNISNGYLNLVLGDSGASTPVTRNPSPVLSIAQVLDNKNTRTNLKCVDQANNIVGTGQSYIPSNLDRRVLRIRVNLHGEEIAADFNMRAVGFSVNSEMLNSKTDDDFVNINNAKGVTKTNVESIFDRFTKLDAILNSFNAGGTSAGINISGNASTATNATTATNVSGTVAIANGGTGATNVTDARTNLGLGTLSTMSPTGTADNTTYLRGDGTWQTVSAGGAVSSVAGRTGAVTLSTSDVSGLGALATKTTSGMADNTTYLRGDGAWTALGGAASQNIGTSAGTVAAGNDSRIVNAVQNVGSDAASNVPAFSAGLDSNKPGSPVAGQMYVATDAQKIYRYDGSSWVTVAQVGGTGFSGSLAGDVSGPQGTTVVDKIKGVAVDNTGLAAGKYLKYFGGSWVPSIVGANDLVSSVTGTTQFTTANCADNQTLTWTSLTDSFVCKNISLPSGQVTGLGALAAKGSVDLGTSDATGTLASARMPALTGDVTVSAGTTATTIASNAITTVKINNLAVTDAKINDVAFSKITSKPTTLSGYGITDAAPTAGSTSITTLGTVTTGAWNGSTIPVGYGGTGATSAAAARTNLGAAASGANSDIASLSATTSVTSSTALALNAGGSNQNVNLVPTGTGTVDVASHRITSVATPTSPEDAATKAYVDAAGGGVTAPTMISALSGSSMRWVAAMQYCRNLNAACARTVDDVACGATTYTGWRLPSFEEIQASAGITGSMGQYLWTRTTALSAGVNTSSGYYVAYSLADGSWTADTSTNYSYVRCVR